MGLFFINVNVYKINSFNNLMCIVHMGGKHGIKPTTNLALTKKRLLRGYQFDCNTAWCRH